MDQREKERETLEQMQSKVSDGGGVMIAIQGDNLM